MIIMIKNINKGVLGMQIVLIDAEEKLCEELRRELGFKTYKDVVVFGLKSIKENADSNKERKEKEKKHHRISSLNHFR